jgi:hypothetical protein
MNGSRPKRYGHSAVVDEDNVYLYGGFKKEHDDELRSS